ncbi:META domain-containing protein [Psychromonas algarum]|uniref:META domain-containing protein n=1 Tax=Psychromonas algarum TaxID=2555643 RepID=UPI00141A6274|nr:META domain-containing protein [Psychromonas sp. RZ22]
MASVKAGFLLLSTIILSACTSDAPIEPKQIKVEQLQHNWKLTHIDNIQLAAIINSTLNITADNKSTGSLGCNHFSGTAELSNNQLQIAKIMSTRKLCSKLENDVEMDVSQVLSDWTNIMIDDETLILSNQKHSLTYQQIDQVAQ